MNLKDEVIETYQSSRTVRATAKKCGCSWNRITKILSTNDIAVSDRHEIILELYRQGRTPQDIADYFGVKRSTIMCFLPAVRPIYGENRSKQAEYLKKYRQQMKKAAE